MTGRLAGVLVAVAHVPDSAPQANRGRHQPNKVGRMPGMYDIEIKGGHGRSVKNRTHSTHYDELDLVRKEDIEDVPEIRCPAVHRVTSG